MLGLYHMTACPMHPVPLTKVVTLFFTVLDPLQWFMVSAAVYRKVKHSIGGMADQNAFKRLMSCVSCMNHAVKCRIVKGAKLAMVSFELCVAGVLVGGHCGYKCAHPSWHHGRQRV